MYKVVNTKTQEEWDIVTKFLNYKWIKTNNFKSYGENTCINLTIKGYGNLKFYTLENSLIYTFEEWNVLNKKPNSIDDLSYLTEFLIKNEIT